MLRGHFGDIADVLVICLSSHLSISLLILAREEGGESERQTSV